jgi:hypothetical protein
MSPASSPPQADFDGTDPPYGIELDSEWRDRAGLNGHSPAEPSYMKQRTKGHTGNHDFKRHTRRLV